MGENDRQNTNPQQSTAAPMVSGKKVIQPSDVFVQEMRAPQPVQTSITSRDFKQPTELTKSDQTSEYNQPTPPVPTVAIPYNVSASQLSLDKQSTKRQLSGYIKPALVFLAVLVVIFGGYFILRGYLIGMTTKTVSNGGYTYSFIFYRNVRKVTLNNGETGLKHGNNVTAGIGPTTFNPPTVCGELNLGGMFTEAFTVQLQGTTRTVCQGQNNQAYSMFFRSLNQNHIFVVTYSKPQNTSVYPALKTIFSSVKITK